MITPDPKDFSVDLSAREVRHKSGAVVSFSEYVSYVDWKTSDSGKIRNADRFEGPDTELLRVAKEVALRSGMTHKKSG